MTATLLLFATSCLAQSTIDLGSVGVEQFNFRKITVTVDATGTPKALLMAIESPTEWDWNRGLDVQFAISGQDDGEILCGVYELVLTERPHGPATIPVVLVNPGGRCRPDAIHILSLQDAEEQIKLALEAERSAKALEARRAYLAKLPVLSNGNQEIFIGADRKCAQQFLEALAMDGLEKRKRMAELLTYCGFTVPTGTHLESRRRMDGFVEVLIVEGPHASKTGWVTSGWIK